jgi:hypothetical protein
MAVMEVLVRHQALQGLASHTLAVEVAQVTLLALLVVVVLVVVVLAHSI